VKERLFKLAKRYGPLVGYPLFYLACLAVFASLTFPYDAVRARIVAAYNDDQRESNGLHELQIESASGYFLTGLRLHGVTWLSGSPEVGKPTTKLSLDEVTVRYAILPALFGGSRLDFGVQAFGGDAHGSLGTRGDDRTVDLTVDSMELSKIPPLTGLLGVPFDGKLDGTARLRLPDGKMSKAAGQVAFDAKSLAVGDGKAKIQGALAMPRVEVGPLLLTADAKEGSLRLTKLSASGKDVDVQGEGRISLRDDLSESTLDVQIRFRINDAYRGKNDVTKSLFGAPGTTGQGLFELADPRVKQSKRADGFYAWTVRGTFGHTDFTPAVGRGQGP
jgi:type II secretion system protein N